MYTRREVSREFSPIRVYYIREISFELILDARVLLLLWLLIIPAAALYNIYVRGYMDTVGWLCFPAEF